MKTSKPCWRASAPCRLRNLDSSVPMMKPAKNRMRNNVSEPLDRACAGRILPKRNMRSHLVIIDGIFRKDSSKVLRVERDRPLATSSCLQRRGDLHPTQADFDPIGRYDYLLTMSRTRLFISTGGMASHRLESLSALRRATSNG